METQKRRTKKPPGAQSRAGCLLALALILPACNMAGMCKVGDDESCPEGSVCYGGEEAKTGEKGVCTEGEFSPEGKRVPTVTVWRLLSSGQTEVLPLRDMGSTADNPHAGWVNAGAASVEAEVYGLKSGEGLKVQTGPQGAEAVCAHQGPAKGSRGALWTCRLEEGWAAAEPEAESVEVKLRPAEGAERSRSYRVDAQAPLVSMLAGPPCNLSNNTCPQKQACLDMGGDLGICQGPLTPETTHLKTFRLCVQARDMQSGMLSMDMETDNPHVTLENLPQEITWHKETEAPFLSCWLGSFSSETDMSAAHFGASLSVKASDKAGNHSVLEAHGSMGRLSCKTQAEGLAFNAVKAPLVVAKGQLIFGSSAGEGATSANNALYFFELDGCKVSSVLPVGAVQGPMVALGSSGRIALALGGGGPEGRSGPRLALVDSQGFVYPEASRDCVPGNGESDKSAVFDKGLALLHKGKADGGDEEDTVAWRFAAPANSAKENASRLMAYVPNTVGERWRCIAHLCSEPSWRDDKMNTASTLTPVQRIYDIEQEDSKSNIIALHGTDAPLLGWWDFHPPSSFFPWHWGQLGIQVPILSNLSGIAGGMCDAKREQVWLSGDGFQRICDPKGEMDPPQEATMLGAHWRTSPAVVDNQGHAYVVAQTPAGTYELQHFASDSVQGSATRCTVGEASACPAKQVCMEGGNGTEGICQGAPLARSPLLKEAPVGSPVLGHPPKGADNAAPGEVYVLTTAGSLQAFSASTLTPLWKQSLGVRVSPAAQPVLVGNTLWLASSNGEVYGVHVDSDGLSRSAQWPKAFHDNCNTSSRLAIFSSGLNTLADVLFYEMPECFR